MKLINHKMFLIMISITLVLLIVGIFFITSRLYFPDLPMSGVTKKQAYEKVFNWHNAIIHLTNDGDYDWYIYQGNQMEGGVELVKRMNTIGNKFIEQLGSGYIFAKEGRPEQIIVTSQQWTGKYILYKVPSEVRF